MMYFVGVKNLVFDSSHMILVDVVTGIPSSLGTIQNIHERWYKPISILTTQPYLPSKLIVIFSSLMNPRWHYY